MPAVPIVLIEPSYWTKIVNFKTLVEEAVIDPADLDLFSYADDAEQAWSELIRRGLNTGPRPPGYPSRTF
jgi:predicted Rossmann-fold nucleotide-binding protein